jgi:hypothetical protein
VYRSRSVSRNGNGSTAPVLENENANISTHLLSFLISIKLVISLSHMK